MLSRAAVELVGERGRDRQPDARPVTDELLEAPPRQPPEDDVGRGARGRGPAREEHAELAKMSRRGDPPKGELAVRRPHADVHRAVRDEIQGVPGRALLGDDRSRREARLLEGSDEARGVEGGEVAEERDAPQQTLKLVLPARRHAGKLPVRLLVRLRRHGDTNARGCTREVRRMRSDGARERPVLLHLRHAHRRLEYDRG